MAGVEGDLQPDGGVVRITAIRVEFRCRIPPDLVAKAERALETFADHCPAYMSVKDCIRVSWSAEFGG